MKSAAIALALIAVAAPSWAAQWQFKKEWQEPGVWSGNPYASGVGNAPVGSQPIKKDPSRSQIVKAIRDCIDRNRGRPNPFCMPEGGTNRDLIEALEE